MDRWACVDLPALPLQIVRRDHPDWRHRPLAVTSHDTPHAPLEWTCPRAAAAGVQVGARAAVATAVCPELVVAHMVSSRLEEALEQCRALLDRFSPRVETVRAPGTSFLLDPRGLMRLFGSERQWRAQIEAAFKEIGFTAHVALADNRVVAMALSRSAPAGGAAESNHREGEIDHLPLSVLDLDGDSRAALSRLGASTIGQFKRLPGGGLALRFGPETAHLQRLLRDGDPRPLHPARPAPSYSSTVSFEPPARSSAQLLRNARELLAALLRDIARRGLALRALRVTLTFKTPPTKTSRTLTPAAPGLDLEIPCELMQLYLDSLERGEISDMHLEIEPVPAEPEQLSIFLGRQGSAPAIARAVARIRAAYGPSSVSRARLSNTFLPERAYRFEPIQTWPPQKKPPPDSAGVTPPTVVRALQSRPSPVPRALARRLKPLTGPQRLEVEWWATPVCRDYHYLQGPDGRVLWAYRHRDDRRERLYLHAEI